MLWFYARCELVEKLSALGKQVARILATIRSASNRTAMVNRLPPEVLAKVLGFRHDDRDLIAATHVCERWRSTLLSTPLLWTEIAFGDPVRTSTYLERSKDAPLHVSIGESALDSSSDDMSWVGRSDSLRINAPKGQIELFAGRLCLPAPLLRSLEFIGYPVFPDFGAVDYSVRIPLGFLGKRAPSLRNLTFISASPSPLTNLPLQNLTSLQWTDRSSSVAIGDLLVLLMSAPLLEVVNLGFWGIYTPGAEPLKVVTLRKLRKLAWVNDRGLLSLMPFLITPELNDLEIRMAYDILHSNPSIILPPHRGHIPLLVEPTALRYVCQSWNSREWYFTSTSGHLTIHETPQLFPGIPPADRWLSPNIPISFGGIKELVVKGFGGYPLPENIPIDQFESVEKLTLVGEVDRLLGILRPNGSTTSKVLPVPFLSRLELHSTLHVDDFPFEALAEILRKRKKAGRTVKTVRVAGEYGGRSSQKASELTKFVDVLTLD